MGRSRQEGCAAAIREQQSLRKRDALLAAALKVASEKRQPQLVAEQVTRRDSAAAVNILRRRTKEARQQLSYRLEERRLKLSLLLEEERRQEKAALERMRHSVALKEQDTMIRAAALRELRDEEKKEQDDRMNALRWRREQEHLEFQKSKLRLEGVVAANEAQIALKIKRQQEEKEEAAMFEALWTEDLNAKRLRERRNVAGKLKKLEQTREALLDQIAKREETRQQEIQRLRAENELEIRRLQEDSEAAARQRQLQQEEAANKRKEMDNALAQQLAERHQLRMKDAALEREQLVAQAKLGLKAQDRAQLMKTMEIANASHIRALMQQDKQKQVQELEEVDAQYMREQAAAEDREERQRAEAERDRKEKEREVDAYRKGQMMEGETRRSAEKAEKAEELKQATATMVHSRADLFRERHERQRSMRAYREALDAQRALADGQPLKCQER